MSGVTRYEVKTEWFIDDLLDYVSIADAVRASNALLGARLESEGLTPGPLRHYCIKEEMHEIAGQATLIPPRVVFTRAALETREN
jgi:hypothetical protein